MDEYRQAFEYIDPKYHADFAQFIENGEMTPEFEGYVNGDERAQKGVELVLDISCAGLQNIFDKLKGLEGKL